jgi:hypothetical protein
MSANRRAIGNLLVTYGKIQEARNSYKNAFIYEPSFVSIGKFALSFFPAKINLWLMGKFG